MTPSELPKKTTVTPRTGALVAFCVVLAALGAYIPGHFAVALEPSVHYRFFFLREIHPGEKISKGDFVVFPKKGDAFHPKGGNAVKEVGCLPGAVVSVNPATRDFFCDQAYLGRAKPATMKGGALPLFEWNGPVPAGKFFAFGSSKDSYDSRYTGWVDQSVVTHMAYPIF